MMDRRGMTIVELLVSTVIGLIVTGTLYLMYHASHVQRRSIARHVDVQRGLRGSMALIQRDLRSAREVVELERDEQGTLRSFLFRVPSGDGKSTASITYTFERKREAEYGLFRRNGRALFEDCLTDFRIVPYVIEDGLKEVRRTTDYGRINLFRVKLAFVPGKTELPKTAQQRAFGFSIYPRIANLRRKAVTSRFNLVSGRFAPYARPSGPPAVEEPE